MANKIFKRKREEGTRQSQMRNEEKQIMFSVKKKKTKKKN